MKKLTIFGLTLLLGLAFAWLPGPDYIEDQYHKAMCIYEVSGDMSMELDERFGACNGECPGKSLLGDMEDSMMNLARYKGTDAAAFGQEYVHFLSLFNQIRWDFLYYGIDYVFDGGDEEINDLGDLFGEFNSYNAYVVSCFEGGNEVTQ